MAVINSTNGQSMLFGKMSKTVKISLKKSEHYRLLAITNLSPHAKELSCLLNFQIVINIFFFSITPFLRLGHVFAVNSVSGGFFVSIHSISVYYQLIVI